jgi:hypothetical protein
LLQLANKHDFHTETGMLTLILPEVLVSCFVQCSFQTENDFEVNVSVSFLILMTAKVLAVVAAAAAAVVVVVVVVVVAAVVVVGGGGNKYQESTISRNYRKQLYWALGKVLM